MAAAAANYFGVIDYIIMVLTVLVSLAIGVYHGFKGNKTAEDFAMGSRGMSPLPVSLSLLATFVSASSILGYSGEAYGHGLTMAWAIVGTVTAIVIAAEVILPVTYPLRLVSPNQYLEIRFNSPWLRRVSFSMTFLSVTVIMGIALYAPTLALSAITPISPTIYIWIMGVVVTAYASFGGLRAVVWADVFQIVLMITGVAVVMVMACVEVGGLGNVWAIATEGGRTNAFITDVSPYTRHTTWNILIMTVTSWFSHYSFSQVCNQRVSAVPSLVLAKRVMYYNCVGMTMFLSMNLLLGVCVYAVYAGCDPYAEGKIFSKDQIVAYFVADKLGHVTGLLGVFVATLLSAALSSLSSGVNSLATLLWADLFSQLPCFRNSSDFVAATASKLLTIVVGSITVGLAFLASTLGGLVQAGYTVVGVMAGPVAGVHLLGLAVPISNKIGAFSGLLSGWGLCVWMVIGSFIHKRRVELLPLSADDCPVPANFTEMVTTMASTIAATTIMTTAGGNETTTLGCDSTNATCDVAEEEAALFLYRISYTLYPFIGFVVCLVVGVLVSFASGHQDPKKVPAELVLFCVRRFVRPVRTEEGDDDVVPGKLHKTGTVETLVMEGVGVDFKPGKDDGRY